MTNEQLNVLGEKLSEYRDAIYSATDKAIIKILDHYGLDVDYVKAHPDEFCILKKPAYGLQDVTENFVIMHKGTTLGSYGIHSQFDDNNMRMTYRIDYTFGGDP